jgi:hypothetical protein
VFNRLIALFTPAPRHQIGEGTYSINRRVRNWKLARMSRQELLVEQTILLDVLLDQVRGANDRLLIILNRMSIPGTED